jgi:hypothetical protein
MQSSSLQPDNSLVSQSKSAPNSVASITGLTPESGFEEFPYDPFPYDPFPYDPFPYDPFPYDPFPYDPFPYDPFPYDPFPYDPNARLVEVSKMFEEYYLDESSIELTLRKWVRSR